MTAHTRATLVSDDFVLGSKAEFNTIKKADLKERITEEALKTYDKKEKEVGSDIMRELERVILLRVVDEKWMDHIDAMDQLRRGIGLRAYGQRDPVIEYKFEGFEMFEEMIRNIREDAVRFILKYRLAESKGTPPKREKVAEPVNAVHAEGIKKPVSVGPKVGRNDPCPCGSGKKYKHCCGGIDRIKQDK